MGIQEGRREGKKQEAEVDWSDGDAAPHLLGSFVDVFSYGWEVCVELAERFHNRRAVWCILKYPAATVRRHLHRVPRESYQFSRDAVVEIFDSALIGVGGERTVRCPIRSGIEEFDGVCYPCLSRCHPWIRDRENGRDGMSAWAILQVADGSAPRTPSR